MLPLRGGNWTNVSRAGVFALSFDCPRGHTNANVGFRAASPPQPDMQSLWALFQCMGDKGICPLAERDYPKLGIGRRFLCAAALVGLTCPGLACSRSPWVIRAGSPTQVLVSAPLYPHSQICKAYGLCVSAEGIKGLVSVPSN